MAPHNGGIYQAIDKLTGSDNYQDWAMSMQAYLEMENLWKVIEAPTPAELDEDSTNNIQTRSRIIMTVNADVRTHFNVTDTAKEIWDKIKAVYDDGALSNVCGTLMDLCATYLHDCNTAEEYVAKKSNAAKRLRAHGVQISDQLVGMLMLMGLPDEHYRPMKMALRNSVTQMTSELAKRSILEEAAQKEIAESHDAHGLYSRAQPRNSWRSNNSNGRYKTSNKKPKCYNCNKYGHYTKECKVKRKSVKAACAMEEDQSDEEDDMEDEDDSEQASANLCVFLNFIATNKDIQDFDLLSSMWIIDSGASRHMCAERSMFTNFRSSTIKSISMANSKRISVTGEGDIILKCQTPDGLCEVMLTRVLCVPEIASNLVSVSCMANNGAYISFNNDSCMVKNSQRKIVMSASQINSGIFKINLAPKLNSKNSISNNIQPIALSATTNTASLFTWHRRLAHLNYQSLSQLANQVEGLRILDKNKPFCQACVHGKQVKNPFPPSHKKANAVLELLHTDLCEVRPTSIEGHRYFMVVYDDYSRMIFAFLLKHKSDAAESLEKFIIFAQNQTNVKVKAIRSDNGTEYVNIRLKNFFKKLGI